MQKLTESSAVLNPVPRGNHQRKAAEPNASYSSSTDMSHGSPLPRSCEITTHLSITINISFAGSPPTLASAWLCDQIFQLRYWDLRSMVWCSVAGQWELTSRIGPCTYGSVCYMSSRQGMGLRTLCRADRSRCIAGGQHANAHRVWKHYLVAQGDKWESCFIITCSSDSPFATRSASSAPFGSDGCPHYL